MVVVHPFLFLAILVRLSLPVMAVGGSATLQSSPEALVKSLTFTVVIALSGTFCSLAEGVSSAAW
eukprot:4294587-Amphidinium_carterae.1